MREIIFEVIGTMVHVSLLSGKEDWFELDPRSRDYQEPRCPQGTRVSTLFKCIKFSACLGKVSEKYYTPLNA